MTQCKEQTALRRDGKTRSILKRLISLEADMLLWSASYADSSIRREPMLSWHVIAGDLELLELDLAPVLEKLAVVGVEAAVSGGPSLDYWARGIKRIGYRRENGKRTDYMVPGMEFPRDARIVCAEFTPAPYFLPYSNMLDMLRFQAHKVDWRLSDTVFEYEGEKVFCLVKLVDALVMGGFDRRRFWKQVTAWKHGMHDRVEVVLGLSADSGASLDTGSDWNIISERLSSVLTTGL